MCVGGAIGFALSTAAGYFLSGLALAARAGGSTVGASASIFGLLGALLYYGRRSGSRHVHAQVMSWAMGAFMFGLLIPGIDNYAHAGGFAGGYLVGRAPGSVEARADQSHR